MDRPSRTICSKLPADFQLCCVQSLLIYPATYTLTCRLVWLRNQFVAGVPTGRSLARGPPAAAGMAARFSNNLQSLAPALRFHLQASSQQTYAYTTQSHRTPPVGVQSQGTHNKAFTRTDATMQALGFRRERTTINQGGYNICSQSAATNLTHHWLTI